jgi:hypothetical protein
MIGVRLGLILILSIQTMLVREGIMTLRSTHIYVAAVALAITALSLAGSSARAFTFESGSNADGSARFADPDDQVNSFGGSGSGVQIGGQNGPTLQFGSQQMVPGLPMIGGGSMGFAPTPQPPDPYGRPPGFGN